MTLKGAAGVLALLVTVEVMGVCSTVGASPLPASSPQIQRLCLEGVRRALELETDRYQGWLANATNETQRKRWQRAVDFLRQERQRFATLAPAAFRMEDAWRYIPGVIMGVYGRAQLSSPAPITLEDAWTRESPPALLHFQGQSRSGPFYTVVAVQGGLTRLTPGKHYRITLQPLMPASYPFPSFYACITDLEASPD